jgi:hypothetical protein
MATAIFTVWSLFMTAGAGPSASPSIAHIGDYTSQAQCNAAATAASTSPKPGPNLSIFYTCIPSK